MMRELIGGRGGGCASVEPAGTVCDVSRREYRSATIVGSLLCVLDDRLEEPLAVYARISLLSSNGTDFGGGSDNEGFSGGWRERGGQGWKGRGSGGD